MAKSAITMAIMLIFFFFIYTVRFIDFEINAAILVIMVIYSATSFA